MNVFVFAVDDLSSKTDEAEKEVKKEGEPEKNGKEPAKANNEVTTRSIKITDSFFPTCVRILIFPLRLLQVIAIPDDDEKSPPAEQESKKNGEEPMETDKPSNGEAESIKEKEAEKEKEKEAESEKKSPEGGEETKTEPSEAKPEEVKGLLLLQFLKNKSSESFSGCSANKHD